MAVMNTDNFLLAKAYGYARFIKCLFVIEQNKLDKLKILWDSCIKLGEKDRSLLEVRLQEIVRDVSKYLKGDKKNLH